MSFRNAPATAAGGRAVAEAAPTARVPETRLARFPVGTSQIFDVSDLDLELSEGKVLGKLGGALKKGISAAIGTLTFVCNKHSKTRRCKKKVAKKRAKKAEKEQDAAKIKELTAAIANLEAGAKDAENEYLDLLDEVKEPEKLGRADDKGDAYGRQLVIYRYETSEKKKDLDDSNDVGEYVIDVTMSKASYSTNKSTPSSVQLDSKPVVEGSPAFGDTFDEDDIMQTLEFYLSDGDELIYLEEDIVKPTKTETHLELRLNGIPLLRTTVGGFTDFSTAIWVLYPRGSTLFVEGGTRKSTGDG
jgi:hypothetical protein